jgi:hypothetical protein
MACDKDNCTLGLLHNVRTKYNIRSISTCKDVYNIRAESSAAQATKSAALSIHDGHETCTK